MTSFTIVLQILKSIKKFLFTNILQKLKPKNKKEKAQEKFFSIHIAESDIAIDCGANIGEYTEHLCYLGGVVYAFEPNPYAFQVLKKRFQDKDNVHCIQKGVLDRNDKMRLYLHEFSGQDQVLWSTGSSLLDFKGNVLKDQYVEIEVVDLCEFIDSLHSRIKLLKMDVEGVECRILKKIIQKGLHEKIDHIFVETHDHKVPELKVETDEIREILKKKGIKNINLDWT